MRRRLVLLGVLGLALPGCDSGTDPVPISRIEIEPEFAFLLRNQSRTFTASLIGNDGAIVTGQPVEWRSSDPSTVSVSGSGVAQALWAGEVEITASAGGVTESVPVWVDLHGTWPLQSVDGRAVPLTLDPAYPCPSTASVRTAPIVIESGSINFSGDDSSFIVRMHQICGSSASHNSIWNAPYRVTGPMIDFLPPPGTTFDPTSNGVLEAHRVTFTYDHPTLDRWPQMRLSFVE